MRIKLGLIFSISQQFRVLQKLRDVYNICSFENVNFLQILCRSVSCAKIQKPQNFCETNRYGRANTFIHSEAVIVGQAKSPPDWRSYLRSIFLL